MSAHLWYLNEDNTESSYTEFNPVVCSRPVRRSEAVSTPASARTVRPAAAVRTPVKAARRKAGKKRTGVKVFFFAIGTLAVALTAFLLKDDVVKACTDIINGEFLVEAGADAHSSRKNKKAREEAFIRTEECASYDKSDPAYEMAESIVAMLERDNDIDTAWEIFNWVHTNVWYQTVSEPMTFEEAAYRGFTVRNGDCYVSFACAKMLLDCAGIPNLMVERYPVITNSHYWNLVQLDGEWYHCDATEFKDHPDMYFMCTDDEINDEHHSFDHDLYPERASGYYDGAFGGGYWFGGDEWYDEDQDYFGPDEYGVWPDEGYGPAIGIHPGEEYYPYEYEDFTGEEYYYPYEYEDQAGEMIIAWEDQY